MTDRRMEKGDLVSTTNPPSDDLESGTDKSDNQREPLTSHTLHRQP